MKIYLIRHGAVENPKQILYGRLPGFKLSKKGVAQVQKIAEELKNLNADIKKIYSSPLERAVQTAEIIAAELGVSKNDIIKDERLIEIDTGKWQGVRLSEFHKHYVQIRAENGLGIPYETAEKVADLINEISKSNENTALVSHWDPIMTFISELKNDWNFFKTGYIETGKYFIINNDSGSWKVEDDNLFDSSRSNHQ